MDSEELVRLFQNPSLLEHRASIIEDPIERLRFLRGEMDIRLLPFDALAKRRRILRDPVAAPLAAAAAGMALVLLSGYTFSRFRPVPESRPALLLPPMLISASAAGNPSGVWLVDTKQDVEAYSNGLRIDNRYAISNVPRKAYQVFPLEHPDIRHVQTQADPMGIIYHTTESILAPFERNQNQTLQRISSEVLNFVRGNRSYHFLIDRFGRVFRVVKEPDVAWHAGHSVWADDRNVYVNLNSSFFGIAFETQTEAAQGMPTATPAQIDAARVLTEMLRDKYHIAASNCVTHAQVSVNPDNGLIGYHTDWAGKFPFQELGLRDNYAEPPASLYAFGFDYDPAFVASTGARLMPGLALAEANLRDRAARLKLPLPAYRMKLRANFREIAGRLRSGESAKETTNEQR